MPTPRLIRYWWNRILREVFGYEPISGLSPATIDVRRQPQEWAACQWPASEAQHRLHLTHHDEPISRYGLLCILVHEVVHAILIHEARDDKVLHGPEFMRYAARVEEVSGLPLLAKYSPSDLAWVAKKVNKIVEY